MADGKTRIYSLPEITNVDSDMYIMLDSGAVGTRKYNLKTMYDKVDGVTEAAQAAQAAATSATTAASQASNAAGAANGAASQAQSTVQDLVTSTQQTVDGLVDDVNDAIEAIGDISELAVPLMSESTRGGAKVGHGLAVEDGALGIGSVTDPTDAGPIVELTANGWAEQDTTAGKNLVGTTSVSIDNVSIPNFTTYTSRGVTYKRNADGSITVTGTATSTTQCGLITEALAEGTYTISGFPAGGSGGSDMYPWDNTTNARPKQSDGTNAPSDYGNVSTFVVPAGHVLNVNIRVISGNTANMTVYPQLELGSTATSYEPYTGAAPSPSPSYPQEIRRVTGHTMAGKTGRFVDVEVQGRNLYPDSLGTFDKASVEFMNGSSNDAYRDGTATFASLSSNYHALSFVHGLVVGTTYTLSMYNHMSVSVLVRDFNLASNTTDLGVILAKSRGSLTFTAHYDTLLIYAGMAGATSGNSGTISELQLERGSTAHAYEPYYHNTLAIPLPSRGWVAALPDGTCDTLTLDGAGGYVWTLATGENVYDGSSDETWALSGGGGLRAYTTDLKTIMSKPTTQPAVLYADRYIVKTNDETYAGVIGISANTLIEIAISPTGSALTLEDFRTELAAHPVTVLYPLATPTRESGYVESMPTVPRHASISCPDLTDLAVRCCADEGAAEIAIAWGRRLSDVTETLQSDLAEAVTDTVAARMEIATVSTNEAYDAQVINGTYEGRNIITVLGVSTFDAAVAQMHTLAQSMSAGNLRLGDYIDVTPTVNTVNKGNAIRYRIAGIGHCYQFGDQSCPWAFWMVPDAPIDMTGSTYAVNTSYIRWNTTATNNGTAEQPIPYLASNLHAWELGEFVPAMPTSLQNVMVNHRIMYEKRYSADGALEESTGWSWGDAGKAFSLSETEVYGQCVWGTKGWSVGADAQLPLFSLKPRRRLSGNRVSWWLRSVRAGSTSYACYVSNYGIAYTYSATHTTVRPWPCFLIG